jgi:hypothetical protein
MSKLRKYFKCPQKILQHTNAWLAYSNKTIPNPALCRAAVAFDPVLTMTGAEAFGRVVAHTACHAGQLAWGRW